MAGSIVNTVQPVISEYFLQPLGLLGLLALIPLLIFYLIRKKPEEQIMPAMMFFMKDKKSGKAHTALRKLLRNLILLFHILLVLGFAAALAHPFFEAPKTADQTVVVFDQSASMSDNMEEARQFVGSNLGGKNTLILAGNDVKVPLEKASSSRVKSYLRNVKSKDVKTDVASGLELASGYEGTVIVASDMDQSLTQADTEEIVENLRNNDRTVNLMDIEETNSWGIVNVEPGKQSSSVDVKNFKEHAVTVTAQGPETTKDLQISGGSVQTVEFETSPGKNTVRLEEDGFKPDNTAYISVPENQNQKVVLLSDDGNPYFEKAIELISFTDIEVVEPPVDRDLDADVYVVGDTSRILSDTVESIENDVEEGSAMVVFSQQGVFNLGFEALPVEKKSGVRNATVNIQKPQKASIQTQVMNVEKVGGEDYASPTGSMVKAEHGDGKVFFYNINDRDFRHQFIYPVFWKNLIQELVDQPSIRQLNLETGEALSSSSIETPGGEQESGEIELEKAGFYSTDNHVYAANLVNEDESYAEEISVEKQISSTSMEKRDVQNLGAILLAVLLLGELAYLYRTGDIR